MVSEREEFCEDLGAPLADAMDQIGIEDADMSDGRALADVVYCLGYRKPSPAADALAHYLERKVGPAPLPIGTRVRVRSAGGHAGTVVGPDGVGFPGLAVRFDAPFPDGFDDGYCCASPNEIEILDE